MTKELLERLGKVAYNADADMHEPEWEQLHESTKETYRCIAEAVAKDLGGMILNALHSIWPQQS